jgi:hypothetical protein
MKHSRLKLKFDSFGKNPTVGCDKGGWFLIYEFSEGEWWDFPVIGWNQQFDRTRAYYFTNPRFPI